MAETLPVSPPPVQNTLASCPTEWTPEWVINYFGLNLMSKAKLIADAHNASLPEQEARPTLCPKEIELWHERLLETLKALQAAIQGMTECDPETKDRIREECEIVFARQNAHASTFCSRAEALELERNALRSRLERAEQEARPAESVLLAGEVPGTWHVKNQFGNWNVIYL